MIYLAEQKNIQKKPHNVIMNNCEKMSITGVCDVESFDDKTIICYTDFGELIIRGNRLHVDNMNVSCGDMEVSGRVLSLVYTDEKPHKSVFSKLFK